MRCLDPVGLVLLLITIGVPPWTYSMPSSKEFTTTTTRRPAQSQIGETIKQLTSQLIDTNVTDTLDTRTPPKVKQQLKKPPPKGEVEKYENSHPGVAVPVVDSDLILEENTKKFNFYKIEPKSTTDRGLSTWVLLNSQTVSPPAHSTTKVVSRRPPTIKQKLNDGKNLTAIDAEIFDKITKPLFKKRPIPTTTTVTPEKEHKFTKIKASLLTDAINSKSKTTESTVKRTTPKTPTTTTSVAADKKKTTLQEVSTISPLTKSENEILKVESKDDEIDLPTTQSTKKATRNRPASTSGNKKKKNKNRRRRPSADKSTASNSTKISTNNKIKEKPIGTQIYNYLSREIMPTVGVGLVGLMVTAGLASYFLYPFGAARRSYDIDRKDKEGTYYYKDEYAPGGVAEEELIGKVIAGMPAKDNNNNNNYYSRSPSSSLRYRQSGDYSDSYKKTQQPAQASVEAVYLTPSRNYDEEARLQNHKVDYYSYNNRKQEETDVTQKFVVGNIPKEIQVQEVTPVVVPEHGPRSIEDSSIAEPSPRDLRTRKRRSSSSTIKNNNDNEIDDSENEIVEKESRRERTSTTTTTTTTTTSSPTTTTKNNVTKKPPQSFMTSLRNLFESGYLLGMEIIQNTSRIITRYFEQVQRQLTGYGSRNATMLKEQPRIQ